MREEGVRFLLDAYQMDEFFISKLVCLQHPIPFLNSQVLVRDRHVPHIPFLLQSVCEHCRRDERTREQMLQLQVVALFNSGILTEYLKEPQWQLP